VAVRQFPHAHANPIYVVVDKQPPRISVDSANWCLMGVDQCWSSKQHTYAESEQEHRHFKLEECGRRDGPGKKRLNVCNESWFDVVKSLVDDLLDEQVSVLIRCVLVSPAVKLIQGGVLVVRFMRCKVNVTQDALGRLYPNAFELSYESHALAFTFWPRSAAKRFYFSAAIGRGIRDLAGK
jgi:hypothetical protein